MKIKSSLSKKLFDIFNVIFMLCVAFITVYPLWYVICASFSDGNRLMADNRALFLPLDFCFDAYVGVFKNKFILGGFTNTFLVLIGGLIISMALTIVAAYGLSRKDVYWNKLIMKLVTITMFFSGGLIPLYLLVSRNLHLNDSLLALILPNAINTFNLIIMRTAFSQIPASLEESARLDGASHFQIMTRIVVPLSMSTIAVILLYYAVERWNAWFYARIFLKDRAKYPLQLILREILINNDTASMSADASANDQLSLGETIKYAVVVISMVPILVVYPFLQRYFVKGVMVGAVKG